MVDITLTSVTIDYNVSCLQSMTNNLHYFYLLYCAACGGQTVWNDLRLLSSSIKVDERLALSRLFSTGPYKCSHLLTYLLLLCPLNSDINLLIKSDLQQC